jgi:hypothetical protein
MTEAEQAVYEKLTDEEVALEIVTRFEFFWHFSEEMMRDAMTSSEVAATIKATAKGREFFEACARTIAQEMIAKGE